MKAEEVYKRVRTNKSGCEGCIFKESKVCDITGFDILAQLELEPCDWDGDYIYVVNSEAKNTIHNNKYKSATPQSCKGCAFQQSHNTECEDCKKFSKHTNAKA